MESFVINRTFCDLVHLRPTCNIEGGGEQQIQTEGAGWRILSARLVPRQWQWQAHGAAHALQMASEDVCCIKCVAEHKPILNKRDGRTD